MKTYTVTEEWNVFMQFLKSDLSLENQSNFGVLHRDNEIYIRCTEEDILEIIRKKYTLTPCKQPNFAFDKDRRWEFLGNEHLFDIFVE